jgi:hypothetical protein
VGDKEHDSPLSCSADARQRIADQHVQHARVLILDLGAASLSCLTTICTLCMMSSGSKPEITTGFMWRLIVRA